MKVIFLKTIKGKGNKDEIKDIASGYANFLIKEGSVVVANEKNIADLNYRLQCEKELDEQETKFAEETKNRIENLPAIKFYQYALPDGSTKESITKKDVAEELTKLANSGIGSLRNIEEIRMKPIKQFGLFNIDIKLYKNIKATLKIEILSI